MSSLQLTPPVVPSPWEPTGTPVRIADIKAVCTAPDGIRLVIVKVDTSEPGLYGVGCATFTQRPLAVVTAIEDYLRPFLIGRNVDDIEDIWQASFVSSYWRNGPVLNNAMSGVDEALWDIKGKRAGMPVYQLLGGKVRRSATVYVHASGSSIPEVVDAVEAFRALGYSHIRAQLEIAGFSTYGAPSGSASTGRPAYAPPLERRPWEPRPYCRAIPRLFEALRDAVDDSVELLHDVHERVPPILAIQLAKDLEPFGLFFIEDLFSPEDQDYFRILRMQSAAPVAMGELFVQPDQYVPLVRDRLIDFMRAHISDLGGLTPARKLAALCEYFGVRTAWHGPGDTSPVGHAANLQLDLACSNFGVQEAHLFGEHTREVFPGCPEVHDGAMWSNERPGLGIDVDEKLAAKFPFPEHPYNGAWAEIRRSDGTVVKP